MSLLFIFVLLLLIAAWYMPGPEVVTQQLENKAHAVTHELRLQHAAAARTCPLQTSCATGPVDASAQLASAYAAAPANSDFRNGNLVSFVAPLQLTSTPPTGPATVQTATFVVTYYRSTLPTARTFYATVLKDLAETIDRNTPVFYGAYSATLGVVDGRGATTIGSGATSYVLPAQQIALPPGTAGFVIPDGAPVMATRAN